MNEDPEVEAEDVAPEIEEPLEELDPEAARQAMFDANLEAFKNHIGGVYRRLVDHKPVSKLVIQDDGDFNVAFEGENVFQRGAKGEADHQIKHLTKHAGRLFMNVTKGAMDPHANDAYERMYDRVEQSGLKIDTQPVRLDSYFLIIYGIGLGQHIDRLIELTKCRTIAFIEPNIDFLYHSCFIYDWATLLDRMKESGAIDFFMTSNAETTANSLQRIFRRDNPMCLDGSLVFHHYDSSIMQGVVKRLNGELGTAVMGLGFFQDEVNMIAQSYINLNGGKTKMIRQVKDSAGLPCIVAGNGPSLEKLLPFIKAKQDDAVVVACGSALETLMDAGIQPDFWVMMERNELVLELALGTAERHDLSQIRCLGSTTVFPGLTELFKDPILFFRPGLSCKPLFATSEEQILVMPDPLSANAGLSAAMHIGFRELYLVGVDVGSRRQDSVHTPGGWYNRLDEPYGELGSRVRGNFGGEVWTTSTLHWSKQSLEILLSVARGRTVYNLSDGAFIEGAVPLHWRAAKIPKLKEPKENYIERLYTNFPEYEQSTFDEKWETAALIDSFYEYRDKILATLDEPGDFGFERALSQLLEPPSANNVKAMLLRGTVFSFGIGYQFLNNRLVNSEERDVLEKIMREEFTVLVESICSRASEVFMEVEDGMPWEKSFLN
jgi:hypothetical protein